MNDAAIRKVISGLPVTSLEQGIDETDAIWFLRDQGRLIRVIWKLMPIALEPLAIACSRGDEVSTET
jgi:hypothetical protein